jgi:AraC-like DNA-binding protein
VHINAQIVLIFALFGSYMVDFFKYLTAGESDRDWGLYLNVVGNTKIAPMSLYPSTEHPTGYHYQWSDGRILKEFQVNYISEGQGTLETNQGTFIVKPGSVMVIRPGIWHRYKPDPKVGWHEHYVGFDGDMARHLLRQSVYSSDQVLIHCGYREALIDTYIKLYDLVLQETPGFQQVCSGLVIQLLGLIVAFKKHQDFSGKHIEQVIQKIRLHIHENLEREIDFPGVAGAHQIGYSYFRKMFKRYTGVSPHQYHLGLKVLRARELILTTQKSIKEISYQLGFSSIYYFSRFFKDRTGVSPKAIRDTKRNRA